MRRLRYTRALAAVGGTLILALPISACGASDEGSAAAPVTSPPAASSTPPTQAPASASTSVAATPTPSGTPAPAPSRVVALGAGDAEIAAALGVIPIAGIDWFALGPGGLGPWALPLLRGAPAPASIPSAELGFEAVAGYDPDLILFARDPIGTGGAGKPSRDLAEIATTVAAPEGLPQWRVQTRAVAAALGKSGAAEELIAGLDARLGAAAAALAGLPERTVVAASVIGESYRVYTSGDARFDVLAELGFTAADIGKDPESGQSFVDIFLDDAAAVFGRAAVVVLYGDPAAARLLSDPAIAGSAAAAAGRVITVGSDRVDLLAAFRVASPPAWTFIIDSFVPQVVALAAPPR